MKTIKRFYKGLFYTKMGQAQVSFLQSMISSLLLIGLYFALGIIELLIIGIILLPTFMVFGLWFVRSEYGPYYQDLKERNKYSPLNQMILHLWFSLVNCVLYPLPENYETLRQTNEKCQKEWLLEAY